MKNPFKKNQDIKLSRNYKRQRAINLDGKEVYMPDYIANLASKIHKEFPS